MSERDACGCRIFRPQSGDGRKYASIQGSRKGIPSQKRLFSRHYGIMHPRLCAWHPPPRQPFRRKRGNPSTGFCTLPPFFQKRKPIRSPVFPRRQEARKPLCGKKFPSLLKERSFFQQRNPPYTAVRIAYMQSQLAYMQPLWNIHAPRRFGFTFPNLPGRCKRPDFLSF